MKRGFDLWKSFPVHQEEKHFWFAFTCHQPENKMYFIETESIYKHPNIE